MIKENKWNQYGFPREETDIKGITIHESSEVNQTAAELFSFYDDVSKENSAVHYVVDATEIIQIMPNDWSVYHTGKGKDFGNLYTIAIEVCGNLKNDLYEAAVDNAVSLIKDLQEQYNLAYTDIYFHKDFNSKVYCPKDLINQYGTAKNFAYQRLFEEE